MKIDFHTHGKLAKKLPFSKEYTEWLFCEAQKSGLDALCLTEHFNTIGFGDIYKYITDSCFKDGDSWITDSGFRIFPGMETDIAEGGHTLILSSVECIMEMNRRLEPYKDKGHFLPVEKLMEMVSEYPAMIGAGHPYRTGGHIPELPREILRKFFFLDINGKDLAEDTKGTWEKMKKLAVSLGLPLIAGSDTHQAVQYGCVWNEFEQTVNRVMDLAKEIKNQAYQIRMSDTLMLRVESAGILKRALKEINALGGDYVSVLLKGAEI